MNELMTRLSADLKNAMIGKDVIATKAIRSLISAIDNAGAVPVESPETLPMSGGIAGATSGLGSTEVARRELSDQDVSRIIQGEIDEIANTIELIGDDSRPEVAELRQQMEILKKYL